VPRVDQLHVDLRRVGEPYRRVIMEVALLEGTVGERQPLGQYLARPHSAALLDLGLGIHRVENSRLPVAAQSYQFLRSRGIQSEPGEADPRSFSSIRWLAMISALTASRAGLH